MGSFIIKDNNISFADISTIINKDLKLSIDDIIIERVTASRKIFENTLRDWDLEYSEKKSLTNEDSFLIQTINFMELTQVLGIYIM